MARTGACYDREHPTCSGEVAGIFRVGVGFVAERCSCHCHINDAEVDNLTTEEKP